jgi:predicted hydrocarbon binding protein
MLPQIPIDVDAATGVWLTDGLPMIYVPRHFFVNNHLAIEAALGRESYSALLYDAGYKSAYTWCAHEAQSQRLDGIAVFEHYLKRLSQRGWGLFSFAHLDTAAGTAQVKLDHSSFVLANPGARGRVCYMFAGWFAGAMDWVKRNDTVLTRSAEIQCRGEGHDHCLFAIHPQQLEPQR